MIENQLEKKLANAMEAGFIGVAGLPNQGYLFWRPYDKDYNN